MKLVTEVVGHHGSECEDLIGNQTAGDDQTQARVLFSLPKKFLLIAASMMEMQDPTRRPCLVGHNNPVVEGEISGFEEVKLQGSFVLLFLLLTDCNEPKSCRLRPGLWFVLEFGSLRCGVGTAPLLGSLNEGF